MERTIHETVEQFYDDPHPGDSYPSWCYHVTEQNNPVAQEHDDFGREEMEEEAAQNDRPQRYEGRWSAFSRSLSQSTECPSFATPHTPFRDPREEQTTSSSSQCDIYGENVHADY